ncbi:phage major capsid protein, P2 family [Croceicoccus sp. BE223]|uniref:phage major capsid protein, P2 family n=1 Tax=Croceicoccus sp. BE223 TaxID=2817716 RepID=UPI0028605D3D|nr:phage major capsid protein, P2 family [Croceicoccus sp. BE223]MDR7101476.1 hypothetical protein [Croceicoccus sp. BE223]
MHTATRALFGAYVSQIALLNSVDSATVKFTVDPAVAQTVEETMQESVEFLQLINVVPVIEQSGEAVGVATTKTTAGRTNTAAGNRRNPADPTDTSDNPYFCTKTDYDWSLRYSKLDAWRHKENFELVVRNAILKQQARDRIMIGWNGTSIAAATDRVANPLLQDVNEGWLHKIRTRAAGQVFDDGNLTVETDGTNNAALKAIYVGAGDLFDGTNAVDADVDYASLDALVLDAKRLIPEWRRSDTELVVIVGHDLVDDKYFQIAQGAGTTATEVEAADRIIRSTKQLGGLPAVRVPFFPADALLITRLDNLSIYWQEGTRRRRLADEPEFDRVANYESVNEDFVVEDLREVALVENIVVGKAPARPAP